MIDGGHILGAAEVRRGDTTAGAGRGQTTLVALFILSLLLPINVSVGPLQLPPYRMLLLVLFVPLMLRLLSGQSGRFNLVDGLMLGSALWAMIALFVNNGLAVIQAAGSYMVELFGAYLLGRIGVRSAEDFLRMTKMLFMLMLVLLVFGVAEAVVRRPILLDLIPKSLPAVYIDPRFGLRRVQSVFAHPILYGAFVSSLFGLIWYVIDHNKSFIGRWPKAAMVAVATFISLSSGALMAFVVQGLLIAYETVTKANARRWTIFGWACVVGYILLDLLTSKSPFHTIVHRLTFSASSSYNRILIFQFGIENVRAHPLFGLGLTEWERPSWMRGSIDNFWLLTAMRYGTPSFLMLALAIILLIRWSARAPMTEPLARACRAGWLTTMGGIVLAAGTVHYWGSIFSFVAFLIGAGAWMIVPGAGIVADAAKMTDRPAKRRTAFDVQLPPPSIGQAEPDRHQTLGSVRRTPGSSPFNSSSRSPSANAKSRP